MSDDRRGMGRGLAAILPRPGDEDGLREIPIELIDPNPRQPRRTFDDAKLAELAESIRARGVLQPIVVRPLAGGRYELVAGERRLRAARIAELDLIPAMLRQADDWERLDLALAENMAREDLNPVEEARACALLVDELGLTREDLGRRVGRSRVAVSNLMRLLDLPEDVLDLLSAGHLTEGHGRALLMASDHADRRRLARAAAAEGWTVRHTENEARAAEGRSEPAVRRTRGGPELHPDQVEAAGRLGDALGRALGADVRVAPKGEGYKVTLAFESLDEAMALAERLGAVEHA
jgi:ParB family transcriptional regulator, chromosome partitioning protein